MSYDIAKGSLSANRPLANSGKMSVKQILQENPKNTDTHCPIWGEQ